MMVSSKGRYALRVMLYLAQNDREELVPLKEIAESQNISMKYLEMIVSLLHKGDMLISGRGKKGGYRLARKSSEYTIGSILKLTEKNLAPVNCLEGGKVTCEKAGYCITLPMWQKLDGIIDDYLEKIHVKKSTYFSFIKRDRNYSDWSNDEYFKMYVDAFIASADFINKTKQKSFSKLSTAERMDWYNNKFYDYVDEIEKEKMTYFALCYQQTTLIINAPDENKAQEKFLGYKWSNRKGQEGIQILSPGGLLYDENDRNSQTHISSMIRNSFLGKECIVEGLEDYAYYLNLKDMLDFSSTGFTKTIKTIKTRELKTTPGLINYRLSDKSFELSIGNRVLSDEVDPDGLYPIYSANDLSLNR